MNKVIHKDHNGVEVSVVKEGHYYVIDAMVKDSKHAVASIKFQDGPVPDKGVNGLTNEALLAILIDRTTHLNNLYHSTDNDSAIRHMSMALAAFNNRTNKRIERGVEGKLIE